MAPIAIVDSCQQSSACEQSTYEHYSLMNPQSTFLEHNYSLRFQSKYSQVDDVILLVQAVSDRFCWCTMAATRDAAQGWCMGGMYSELMKVRDKTHGSDASSITQAQLHAVTRERENREYVLNWWRWTVTLRRPKRARNEESTGPHRLHETRQVPWGSWDFIRKAF